MIASNHHYSGTFSGCWTVPEFVTPIGGDVPLSQFGVCTDFAGTTPSFSRNRPEICAVHGWVRCAFIGPSHACFRWVSSCPRPSIYRDIIVFMEIDLFCLKDSKYRQHRLINVRHRPISTVPCLQRLFRISLSHVVKLRVL